MEYGVKREFKDKYSQKRYYTDGVYESDDANRIAFLQNEGYLGEEIPPISQVKEQAVKPNANTGRRKNSTKI